jgi:hypothetical protein
MDTVANRLYQFLVETLRARGIDLADRPVTVAEIYQELVPYRGVREELGVDLNADYEHALLRLLAGEGDLLRLEPSAARDELRLELESPNPYVGLYRKFAACDVWVRADAHQQVAPADLRPEAKNVAAGSTDTAQPAANLVDAGAAATLSGAAVLAEPEIAEPRSASTTPTTAAPTTCTFCGEALPPGRAANYCPSCGGDQRHHPCADCGEVLEQGWRFCIACGSAAAG